MNETLMNGFYSSPVIPIPIPLEGKPEPHNSGWYDKAELIRYLQFLRNNKVNVVMTTAGTSQFNLTRKGVIGSFSDDVLLNWHDYKIIGLPPLSLTQLNRYFDKYPIRNADEQTSLMALYPDRYYNDKDIVDYFYDVADLCDPIPVFIHGMFMRNGVGKGNYNYTPVLIEKIIQHPNIIGIKEECETFEQAYEVSRLASPNFVVISAGGSMRRFILTHAAGAQTFLGGMGNLFPKIEIEFFEALVKDKDYGKAKIILQKLENPFFDVFMKIGWHRALHEALGYMSLMKIKEQEPFSKPDEEEREVIHDVIDYIKEKII